MSVVDKMFAGKVLIAPDVVAAFLQLFCLETALCRCSTTRREGTLHTHAPSPPIPTEKSGGYDHRNNNLHN